MYPPPTELKSIALDESTLIPLQIVAAVANRYLDEMKVLSHKKIIQVTEREGLVGMTSKDTEAFLRDRIAFLLQIDREKFAQNYNRSIDEIHRRMASRSHEEIQGLLGSFEEGVKSLARIAGSL